MAMTETHFNTSLLPQSKFSTSASYVGDYGSALQRETIRCPDEGQPGFLDAREDFDIESKSLSRLTHKRFPVSSFANSTRRHGQNVIYSECLGFIEKLLHGQVGAFDSVRLQTAALMNPKAETHKSAFVEERFEALVSALSNQQPD